jgi:hypothetical protein
MVEPGRSDRTGKSRRKLIPPPPAWPRGTAAILHELSGPSGIVLWQLARDIKLWAAAKEEARPALFRAASPSPAPAALGSHPELTPTVLRIADLLRPSAQPDPESLAFSAFELARWAESRGLRSTALEFAEAAALADGGNADYPTLAGRLARLTGEVKRAAAWYARAIGLSRGNHHAYIPAQLGYGDVLYEVGNNEKARQALRRASRLAIKYGRRGLAAQANHQLLLIACRVGTFAQGAAAAEKALERYPVRHPRLPELAQAFAELLMKEGYISSAVLLLQQLVGVAGGGDQVVAQGMLARCFGALGDRPGFSASCDAVIGAGDGDPRAALGLVHVAAGALALGDRDDPASGLAGDAVSLARRFGLRIVETDAADLLEEMARGAGRERPPAREAPLSIQVLVASFVRRLEKRGASA